MIRNELDRIIKEYHITIDRFDDVALESRCLTETMQETSTKISYADNWFKINSLDINDKTHEQVILSQLMFYKVIKEFTNNNINIPFLDILEKRLDLPILVTKTKFDEYISSIVQRSSNLIIVDIFGRIYEDFVPQKERRRLGQFRTPEPIAMLMVSLLLQNCKRNQSYNLLDIGSGAGIFLLYLYNIALSKGVNMNLEGIEINPLLANALISNFNLYGYPIPEIHLKDFLFMNFEKKYDFVICNPPYTRHHSIPDDKKNKLIKEFKRRYGIEISRLSSMPVYFILKALDVLKDGGHGIFIVSTEVFDAKYGAQIKKFLYKHIQIDFLLKFSQTNDAFPDVDVTAVIISFTKRKPSNAHKIKLGVVNSLSYLNQILNDIGKHSDGHLKYEWGEMRAVYQTNLDPEFKLQYILNGMTPNSKVGNNIVYLKDVANIMRGIATGANKFFLLTDDEVKKFSLNKYVVPAIDKNRYIQDIWLTNEDWRKLKLSKKKVWLLYINSNSYIDKSLERYLSIGVSLGIPERSLVKTRKKWYYMEKRDIPPIIFTYLSRDNPRFILNEAQVRPLNTFLLIYPKYVIIKNNLTEVLWAILNSTIVIENLRNIGRAYGSNTTKIEPREMDKLPIINPLDLPEGVIQEIRDVIAMFNKTRNRQQFINSIDKIIQEYLRGFGFSGIPLKARNQLYLSEYE